MRPHEYVEGLKILKRKVRRWKPRAIAFIGVTLYRAVAGVRASVPVALGEQPEKFEGARVFVVPNPSGRNANFTYDEMLIAFRRLRER